MAKRYFAMIDGKQSGPFALEELSDAGVTPDTYVWCKGMDDWEQARDNADICRAFRQRIFDIQHPAPDYSSPKETPVSDALDDVPIRFRDFVRRSGMEPDGRNEEGNDCSIPPPNQLPMAVLVTIFCCFLTGVVAIYFAMATSRAWNRGEHEKAYDLHRKAKMWIGISFFLGIIMTVIWFQIAR